MNEMLDFGFFEVSCLLGWTVPERYVDVDAMRGSSRATGFKYVCVLFVLRMVF